MKQNKSLTMEFEVGKLKNDHTKKSDNICL